MFCCQWPDFASQNSLAGAFWQTNQINPAACQGWVALRLNTERVSYFIMCFRLFGSWNLTQHREHFLLGTGPELLWWEQRVCWSTAAFIPLSLTSALAIFCRLNVQHLSRPSVCAVCGLHGEHAHNLLVLQPLPVVSTCNKSKDGAKIQCAFLMCKIGSIV